MCCAIHVPSHYVMLFRAANGMRYSAVLKPASAEVAIASFIFARIRVTAYEFDEGPAAEA